MFVFLISLWSDGLIRWSIWTVFLPLWLWKMTLMFGAAIGIGMWCHKPEARSVKIKSVVSILFFAFGEKALRLVWESQGPSFTWNNFVRLPALQISTQCVIYARLMWEQLLPIALLLQIREKSFYSVQSDDHQHIVTPTSYTIRDSSLHQDREWLWQIPMDISICTTHVHINFSNHPMSMGNQKWTRIWGEIFVIKEDWPLIDY